MWLYDEGLWWDRTRGEGWAKEGNVLVRLRDEPRLPPALPELYWLDFGGDRYHGEVMVHAYDAKRELYPPEVAALREFLMGLRIKVNAYLQKTVRKTR